MEIENIAYVVMVIIFLLFRFFMKKKNPKQTPKRQVNRPVQNQPVSTSKQQQRQQRPQVKRAQPASTTTTANPFDDIFKELMNEVQGKKTQPKPKPVAKKPMPKSIEYQSHKEVHPKGFEKKINKLRQERNLMEDNMDESTLDFDFDLQQAVIYDAVMNRPYK